MVLGGEKSLMRKIFFLGSELGVRRTGKLL